jgi:uncharacterized protein YndB with AHSA1/START domain
MRENSMSKLELTVIKEELRTVMKREFDAPRELVWKVWTDPEMVPKWWGPRGVTTTVDKMDVKVGGEWRYVQKDEKGEEYGFRGEYKEVVAPEKIIYTFEFEPMPGHVITETVEFVDQNGKTLMIDTSTYANIEDLEGMLQSGMEGGANESMDRLEEVLVELK